MFISGIVNENEITRVMVDNGSTTTTLPKRTLLIIWLTPGHLQHSDLVVQGFNRSEQHPLEIFVIKTPFREIEVFNDYWWPISTQLLIHFWTVRGCMKILRYRLHITNASRSSQEEQLAIHAENDLSAVAETYNGASL